MIFAILLRGPTTLFTNAVPADGDIPETIQVEYTVFLEKDCPLTADATAHNGDLLVMSLAGVGSSGGRVDNYTLEKGRGGFQDVKAVQFSLVPFDCLDDRK